MAISKNYTTVDLFKFIASIMVVAIHTQPYISNALADYWITSACRIAVPFFFVVGSYFYFSSNKPIWNYIKRLWVLYLVWFVIELPSIYERFFIGTPFFKGMIYFIRGLLLNNTFYASWYITASWQALLITYLLAKRSTVLLYIIGILCAFLSVSNAMYAHFFDNDIWNSFTHYTNMCFASNSFIAAIPFCIIGRFIAIHREKILTHKRAFAFCLGAFIILGCIEVFYCKPYYEITDSFWLLYPIALTLVVLLISYNIPINEEASRILRKMSILVYLSHCIVIRLIKGLFDIDSGLTLFLSTALITIVISYLIVLLSKRIRILKYLY